MIDSTMQKAKIKEIRENLKYKKYQLGKKLIEEYIDTYGVDCYIELENARYYRYLSNYEKAIEILNNLANTNPKNIGYVLFELGKIYEETKDYQKAIKFYNEIDNTNHKNKEYSYFALGTIYENLFDNEKAIYYFKKAIFSGSKFSEEAKLHVARNYIYLTQYEKASEYLKKISTNNDPKLICYVKFYDAKIESYFGNKNNYVEKINDLVKCYPNFILGLSEKCRILFSQKKYEEGKKFLTRIHISDEDRKEYCSYEILRAEYYEKTNQYVKALKIYDDLLNNHVEGLKPAEIARIKLGIAICYVGIGEIDKGYELFKNQSHNSDFYNIACIFNVISIEIYRGNYEEAYKLLKASENLDNINKIDIYDLKLMLSKFIDIDMPESRNLLYREKQIINYNKKMAITHIDSGHGFTNASTDEGAFLSNVDLNKLMDEIKPQLSKDNIIALNIFKKHKIYYKNIGIFDGEPLDYLLVVTPLYSNDIITMYPTNQLLVEKMEAKPKEKIIKRESQIEKFNRRYGKK